MGELHIIQTVLPIQIHSQGENENESRLREKPGCYTLHVNRKWIKNKTLKNSKNLISICK